MNLMELTEVFRQKDQRFVAILNEVREGDISDEALAELNARVGTVPRADGHRWVWLCTTNKEAADVNRRCLDALAGHARVYRAAVHGVFEGLSRRRNSDGGALPADLEGGRPRYLHSQ